MPKVLKRRRKTKAKQQSFGAAEGSFGEGSPALQNNNLSLNNDGDHRICHQQSREMIMREGEEQNMIGSNMNQLQRPYQFLKTDNPPLHTIFFPHFTVKSINFGLSIVFAVAFLILLIYSKTKPQQNSLTWNCSIFELQNKYYPRIRYEFQFWRVIVSGLFHSSVAHFLLNLIGLQIYGYFVEWYYGKIKYSITLIFAVILSHFLSCVAQPTTVSTVSSSILYAILALKIYFFFQYRNYQPLQNRRLFLYVLLGLIFTINLIPIFVSNNVDFTTHIGGLFCGLMTAIFFHFQRLEQQQKKQLTKLQKALKFGSLLMITAMIIALVAIMFSMEDDNQHYQTLNDTIASKCSSG